MRTKEEPKKAACEAIDRNCDKIFDEPELGFREVKTSEKFSRLLDELGFKQQGAAIVIVALITFFGTFIGSVLIGQTVLGLSGVI